MTWLCDELVVPTPLETERFLLRPITIHDVVKDHDAVMGCVDVDPARDDEADAEVACRTRADEADPGREEDPAAAVRRWIAEEWPFARVVYP